MVKMALKSSHILFLDSHGTIIPGFAVSFTLIEDIAPRYRQPMGPLEANGDQK